MTFAQTVARTTVLCHNKGDKKRRLHGAANTWGQVRRADVTGWTGTIVHPRAGRVKGCGPAFWFAADTTTGEREEAMQRKEMVRQLAPFNIPDHYLNVLRWFEETLEPYTECEHEGLPTIKLDMLGPRPEKIRGPDGSEAAVQEIIMRGTRTKGAPIPADWGGGYVYAGWEEAQQPLGPVMVFRFYPISRAETRVWASYREDLATVLSLFKRFVTEEIEKQYPAVGLLWREHEAKLEMQRLELVEKSMQMKSAAAADRNTVEAGPVTGTGGAETAVACETLTGQPADLPKAKKPYRMSQEMRQRHKVSKQLHDAHPGWTCDDIADKLNSALTTAHLRRVKRAGDELTGQDINNAFDAAHKEDPGNPLFAAGYDRLGERRPKNL